MQPTVGLTLLSIIYEEDRSIATNTKSNNCARLNQTPTEAATEIVDSFIVLLQHMLAKQAYHYCKVLKIFQWIQEQ